jgi:hypothetical protein
MNRRGFLGVIAGALAAIGLKAPAQAAEFTITHRTDLVGEPWEVSVVRRVNGSEYEWYTLYDHYPTRHDLAIVKKRTALASARAATVRA